MQSETQPKQGELDNLFTPLHVNFFSVQSYLVQVESLSFIDIAQTLPLNQ